MLSIRVINGKCQQLSYSYPNYVMELRATDKLRGLQFLDAIIILFF